MSIFRLLVWLLNRFRKYRLRYCGNDKWLILDRSGQAVDTANDIWEARRKRRYWNWYAA